MKLRMKKFYLNSGSFAQEALHNLFTHFYIEIIQI